MPSRARELVDALVLSPHPEGGHYRRVHASSLHVRLEGNEHRRAALTAIHYLLAAGEVSRWHRVDADESWHHAEGEPLELFVFDPAARRLDRHLLGRFDATTGASPLVVVPAGCWQAARALGDYVLVGCSVGPGFEFAGFTLLADAPDVAALLMAMRPELAALA
ncbi:cupin domain-containing protein [Dokdonella soli]|uniref:Cupin domain-containing protein n=1 Tax=Dokdonella soli TaxID=529810 RepID=A0ABP3U4M7_9GAMM